MIRRVLIFGLEVLVFGAILVGFVWAIAAEPVWIAAALWAAVMFAWFFDWWRQTTP